MDGSPQIEYWLKRAIRGTKSACIDVGNITLTPLNHECRERVKRARQKLAETLVELEEISSWYPEQD